MRTAEGRTSTIARPAMQDVKEMCVGKEGIISLAQGVTQMAPPAKALEAAIARMGEAHAYAPDPGLPELREALAADYSSRKGVPTVPANIMVTCGANQAFYLALQAVTRPGDRVALFAPYYFNHRMAVEMSGCEPVLIPRTAEGQPDLNTLERILRGGVRAVASVSPDNPTGVMHRPEMQGELARMCAEKGVWLLSDEVYEDFAYDHPHESCARRAPESTITFHSFSKSFGMPGWRVGYLRAPEPLMEGLVKAQDTVAISAPTLSQLLALECLRVGRGGVEREAARLRGLRDTFRKGLEGIPGCEPYPMQGAFYAWLRLGTPMDGWSAVKRLIDGHRIAVAPGEPFGAPSTAVRVSYGNIANADASEALSRLVAGLSEICGGAN